MRRLLLLLAFPVLVQAQNINRVEYFWDTDPGPGNGTPLAFVPAPSLTLTPTLPLAGVSEGFHILYFRVRSAGKWSLPLARAVYVQRGAQTASASLISRLEYFVDTDPGRGNGVSVPITSAANVSQNFTLLLGPITEGFHLVYFRARAVNAQWSIPVAKPVFVQRNAQTAASPALRRLEYFFDSDPGPGNGIEVPLTLSSEDRSMILDLSGVSPGFHVLHLRAEDISGRWSMITTRPFAVEYNGDNIVALDYFFTDGATTSATRVFTGFSPGTNLTVNFAAALGALNPGTAYDLHIRARNARGQYSTEAIHAFTTPAIICDPLSPPVTTGASLCGSGPAALSASGATAGQSYLWYPDATGTTPIAGATSGTYNTPVLTSTTTYYAVILNGTCESARTAAVATVQNCNTAPTLASAIFTAAAGSSLVIPVLSLVSDPDNNIDPASLQVIAPPLSGAGVQINNGVLTLNYDGIIFAGQDRLTVQVCDQAGACVQQILLIDVIGDIKIFNAVSPNGDGKNDYLFIQYIDAFPETQQNKLTIYNRWGVVVFEASNYDNTTDVFRGLSNSGAELPSGTYYYVLEFNSGMPKRNGFISLRR
ncbi:MAG: gliding motility-associated C-terminal domain-containing protein [Cyclobacteriaceae bacterium]|nr:gliding motility-associated C-terminal domain-containing protein [Cyclobacteriaceae bacterium]